VTDESDHETRAGSTHAAAPSKTPRDDSAPLTPFLVVIEDQESWRFRLPPAGTVTIGRIAACEVQLRDPTTSRKHAQLRIDGEHIYLSDLGSFNGTAVNGETVRGERELHSGDLIQICGTAITFHVPERRGVVAQPTVVGESVFHPRLAIELERCRRFSRQFALFAVRVVGESQLRKGGAALAAALRAIDTVATDGDTGLLVLAPELGIDEVEPIAKIMLSALGPLVAHVGVATYPDDGVDAATLLATSRAAAREAGAGEMFTAGRIARRLDLGTVKIVVADPAMMRTFALIERLAVSELPVLIQGETGSGKESAAAAVHHYSRRRNGPLVTINCAAIPENLVESELFGHEKGAFTGAVATREGLFEAGSGGTVFLDEVGELPLAVQAKLLRALDTHKVTRVGGTSERPIDVRIVAATNRDLQVEVKERRFREDLYFRLGGATIPLPPLRDRLRDLPLLARELLALACVRMKRDPVTLSGAAMQAIASYRWPGNVRELRNAMEFAAAQVDGDEVERWHLPPAVTGEPGDDAPGRAQEPVAGDTSSDSIFQSPHRTPRRPADSFRPIAEELRALERKRMVQALITADGVQTRAAQLLRMPRRTFVAKMKEYAIHEELERGTRV
jgi:two-component system response regulator AtoC